MLLVNEAHLLASEASKLVYAHLCDLFVIDKDTSCVCLVKTCTDVEECRLTGTGGTDDCYKLALLDLDVSTVNCCNYGFRLSVLFNNVFGLKHIFYFFSCHFFILSDAGFRTII